MFRYKINRPENWKTQNLYGMLLNRTDNFDDEILYDYITH